MAERFTFWEDLKRRRVVRVGLAYAGAAFVILQAGDLLLAALGMPSTALRWVVVLLAVGFPVVLLISWIFDFTSEGIRLTARSGGEGRLVVRLRSPVLIGGGLLFVATVGTLIAVNRPRPATASVAPSADLIAVLPFTTHGPGMEVLQRGMVDLLSRNLNEVGGVRTVDPRTVLHRWSRVDGPLSLEQSLALGWEVDAASVLTGSVVAVGSQVQFSAELFALDGARIAEARVEGPAESVLELIDTLSIALLREIWRAETALPDLSIGAITSGNLEAIRAFLQGEQYYREARWSDAVGAFRRAVAADSSFALAHFRLAASTGWWGTPETREQAERSTGIVLRFLDQLPERERLLARSQALRASGERAAAVDSLGAYVERYPDDPEAWFWLADDLFHLREGPGGLRERYPSRESLWIFERALELDPGFTPALIHPMEVAFSTGDRAYAERLLGMVVDVPSTREAVRIYRAGLAVLADTLRVADLARAFTLVAEGMEGERDLRWQAASAVLPAVQRRALLLPARTRESLLAVLERETGGSRVVRLRALSHLVSGEVEEMERVLRQARERHLLSRPEVEGVRRLALYTGYAGDDPLAGGEPLPDSVVRVAQLLSAIDRGDVGDIRGAVRRLRSQDAPNGEARARLRAITGAGEAFARHLQGDAGAIGGVRAALESVAFRTGSTEEALWYRWLKAAARDPSHRASVADLVERPWPGHPVYEPLRLRLLASAR